MCVAQGSRVQSQPPSAAPGPPPKKQHTKRAPPHPTKKPAPRAVGARLRLEAARVQPVLKHVVRVRARAPPAARAARLGAELREVRLRRAPHDALAGVRVRARVPVVARVQRVGALDDLFWGGRGVCVRVWVCGVVVSGVCEGGVEDWRRGGAEAGTGLLRLRNLFAVPGTQWLGETAAGRGNRSAACSAHSSASLSP